MVDHRVMRWVVAIGVGLILALYVFQRVSDPEPGIRRAREEAVVMSSREILHRYVSPDAPLELVDPLAPDRKVGKVYIYPTDRGWEVSGHYRRDEHDRWHPYLMQLDEGVELIHLLVRDPDALLTDLAATDGRFSVEP